MYCVQGYFETNGADTDKSFDVNTNYVSNDNTSDQFVDVEVVEFAAKKQQNTSERVCDNVFKVAAQAYWSKDNFESSVNHTLADTINEFFREGFSEDIYSIMS